MVNTRKNKNIEKFKNKIVVIPNVKEWSKVIETNKYSLRQRLQCLIDSDITPMSQWLDHPEWTLEELEKNVKVCSLYPFPVGLEILKIFKPTRWLDPTAGWGDRLRCAIEYGVPYVGIDSNTNMHSAYKMIVNENAKGDHNTYKVIPGKFQDAKIQGKFDLVFTSPPFYSYETYNSMNSWKTVDDFLNKFLYVLLEKSSEYLLKDGHLILYIEDKPKLRFITLMKEYVTKNIPSLKYEGIIYYQGRPSLRPYYIWKKI